MTQFKDLFGGPNAVIGAPDRQLSTPVELAEIAQPLLRKALTLVVQRWLEFMNGETSGFMSPDLTDGVAAWNFVRAKYYGGTYPRYMSVVFCPLQIETVGDKGAISDFMRAVVSGEIDAIDSVEWAIAEDCRMTKFLLSAGLGYRGHRMPLDFPASTAHQLIDQYCPKGGSVLDPCHGWGGRLTGFLLAKNPRRYVGCDPSPIANAGLKRIWATLLPYAEKEKVAKLIRKPFEDAKIAEQFDMALTSPPYYDTESYSGDDQSFKRYGSFEEWCEHFYFKVFERASALLKPGAHFLINVGNQRYPLVELAEDFGMANGFDHVRTQRKLLLAGYNQTSAERGESLIILRKAD